MNFGKLNQALKNYKRAIPFLVLDLDALDKNIAELKANIPEGNKFRIVVKSLPSTNLVDYIMKAVPTQELMLFHQPFLSDISKHLSNQADVLLGKPMPVKTAAYYYGSLKGEEIQFNPFQQVQWLVDTEERIKEYQKLANSLGKQLRLNLELDVGLHRGGFTTLESLSAALKIFQVHKKDISFSGLMGYDPHVVKLPKIIRSPKKALQLANRFYAEAKALIKNDFPDLWKEDLCFNGAGSPTLVLHNTSASPLNDIASGSCLVKPTTFDIPSLENYVPAAYIATPILKKFVNTKIPAIESLSKVLNVLSSANQRSYFIYGGFWKADFCYPKQIKENALFGVSTNQTMINAPAKVNLEVDDFVFLRPHQSEFVFLQFGNILAYREGQEIKEWNLLKQV